MYFDIIDYYNTKGMTIQSIMFDDESAKLNLILVESKEISGELINKFSIHSYEFIDRDIFFFTQS